MMLEDYGRWATKGKDSKNNVDFIKEELQKAPIKQPNETTSTNETEERTAKNEKLHGLLNSITKNMCVLEESVKLSHCTERMIFQNELQLLIDRHQLDFELEREKCKNSRLKRMNSDNSFSILLPSDHEEIKYLRKKCQNLTAVMKKRSGQINKALAQIRGLKNEKERLKLLIKEKDSKIKEMYNHYSEQLLEMNQKATKMKEEADKEKQKYSENNLQIALKEQIKQNKQLIYSNCQLKTQIAQSKTVDKFNIATQVSLNNIFKQMYHKDVSG